MNIIVLQDVQSITSGSGYNNCIKIAYLLGEKLISAGVDDQYIYYKDNMSNLPIDMKLTILINYHENEKETVSGLRRYKEIIKNYNRTKGKSSKEIIGFKLLMKSFDKTFDDYTQMQHDSLNIAYGIEIISELIDEESFFLLPPRWTSPDNTELGHTVVSDIFTLKLRDYMDDNFIFFLNLESINPDKKFEIEFENIDNENAKNINLSYGEVAFTIPLLGLSSTNDMKAAKNQLRNKTTDFRNKMKEWTKICYENPTEIEGLNYLKTTFKPLFKKIESELSENPTIKNIPKQSNVVKEYQVIIAQMPVSKIWKLMNETNNMNDEEYIRVQEIKLQQPNKFEGRWPILFLKPVPVDDIEVYYEKIKDSQTIQSVKKSITLD
jgi:hypothetical protein